MPSKKHYTKITVNGPVAIDTIFDNVRTRNEKHFVSSFQGAGNLQVSDDGTNWRDTGVGENDPITLQDSLQRYIRINAAGEKTIYMISL